MQGLTANSTDGSDLQSASVQNGFQTGPSRQAFFAPTPATNNAAQQQQFDTALWSKVSVPNNSLSRDTTSLVGASQDGQPGDGWFAPEFAVPAEVGQDAQPVAEE
jgi:hypothetical protein